MENSKLWIDWIVELQSLAQAGLAYGRDAYDRERYQRIRDISAEMMANITDVPLQKVKNLFCNETGYQTPKIDTRAAIFQDDRILLVHERDGKWSLPGGWCDVNLSAAENTVKEVKEEAGLDVTPERLIALQDWSKHNVVNHVYGICKIFILCSVIGGEFRENIETTECAYFPEDNLPALATEKTTIEQISACFRAYREGERWNPLFD